RITASSRVVVEIDRRLARLVDAVIVKSREMAHVLRPVVAHVIPNGVDLDAFQPLDRSAARDRLGWHDRKPRVLFPGNPALPNKGFPLARAAVDVASSALGEAVEIVLLSDIAPHQVPVYLSACDALLVASYIEGSPNSVMQAMYLIFSFIVDQLGDIT